MVLLDECLVGPVAYNIKDFDESSVGTSIVATATTDTFAVNEPLEDVIVVDSGAYGGDDSEIGK